MSYQLQLRIAIQHPEVYGFIWLESQTSKQSQLLVKPEQKGDLLPLIEQAIINFVPLLSPIDAVWAVPILKLCFAVLKFQQKK
ncbi:MAG TPA: hypothetical protein VK203_30675 [Nostocaceae cyanobacterium]|nr:hypothetical protein [Nostocaceae cyanobacterium]